MVKSKLQWDFKTVICELFEVFFFNKMSFLFFAPDYLPFLVAEMMSPVKGRMSRKSVWTNLKVIPINHHL